MRRLLALLLCAAVAAAAPLSAKSPTIHTAEAPLEPSAAAASMQVSEGFEVSLFAGEPDVMQPIGFCLDDRGRLWVAEAYNYPVHGTRAGDRIIILEDRDGDGRHDKRTVFFEGLNYVTGIEVGFGGVWVMSPPYFYFIPDADGNDRPDGAPQVLLDGFGNHANAHNLANALAWGPDGWLYGTHGRTNWSLVGKPGTPEADRIRFDGGVYRYHPVRHQWEPFADGTTNPWGIDWNDYGHAFVCNCVNPHLFQVIQGAHYEPWRGRKSSEFAYQRIDTIADHLHFVGVSNVRDGLGSEAEDTAGGGHAHCGTMIYLGDRFPPEYRNQLFTNNIHGRRINCDLLRRSGSGYIASHGPDLMRAADPWFVGVNLTYGREGEVYVSDWSDTGECHSTVNTRRHTGRIYRITYREAAESSADAETSPVARPAMDLARASDAELVDLQLHDNDWFVRHARRLLQERAARGEAMGEVHAALREQFRTQTAVPKRLRALWALHATGGLDDAFLLSLLGTLHSNPPRQARGSASQVDENLVSWSIRLLCEDGEPPAEALQRFAALARHGDSPLVRLELASALQRLTPRDRWPIAEGLAGRGEDVDDANLPLMLWYGVEPLIQDDLPRYVRLATSTAIPRVRTNIARRIASSEDSADGLRLLGEQLQRLPLEQAGAANPVQRELLEGILQGLEGRRSAAMPAQWQAAYQQLQKHADLRVQEQAMRLALIFSDSGAIRSLRAVAIDRSAPPALRTATIDALVAGRIEGFGRALLTLLDDPSVVRTVLRGLAAYDQEETAAAILDRYEKLSASERQVALATLVSREAWAEALLDAVQAKRIPPAELTAFTARQLRSLGSQRIDSRLEQLWGKVQETPEDRRAQIDRLKAWLSSEAAGEADLVRGKALFTQHCAGCHRFFGQGGNVGPDITGAQRTNLDYLLENIVDPSGSVSNDYRMHIVQTDDGRIITGLLASEDPHSLTILTVEDRIVVPVDEIVARKRSPVSIMPVGLLEPLSDAEVRDLFGYLQSTP
ncbi:PVC-type heme-binding CxxCH protein [Candidatus Laterigemmans baculatus]|uniref:PVC-type heme-binding CxxCH protein n=1 Tax=Candidatus Laterigemmans baculatus TaxID=2770505 RepID=UPI0013DAB6BB|nr:PVC-type heme-binding CxxCH protein [Candidatus Laterigemmans baculatus]